MKSCFFISISCKKKSCRDQFNDKDFQSHSFDYLCSFVITEFEPFHAIMALLKPIINPACGDLIVHRY